MLKATLDDTLYLFKKHQKDFLLLAVFMSAIYYLIELVFFGGISTDVDTSQDSVNPNSLLFPILVSTVVGFLFSALTISYVASVRRGSPSIKSSLLIGMSKIFPIVMVYILGGLAIASGLMLLIVPGIILMVRLSLSAYYVVLSNLDAVSALKASWHKTKGYFTIIFFAYVAMFVASIALSSTDSFLIEQMPALKYPLHLVYMIVSELITIMMTIFIYRVFSYSED
ncbi:hypothetical protein [Marinomonas mediterranea]|uniref:hypothetical protein n=1 Tax=Marinomonas mediterranea TaxID=119864 RepID=UPI00234A4A62|nr:hypothetical protein [Marinomonas mediterranea]WCN07781.1 hypothetical protein GV055_01995 [Marinomonas mediterranea]